MAGKSIIELYESDTEIQKAVRRASGLARALKIILDKIDMQNPADREAVSALAELVSINADKALELSGAEIERRWPKEADPIGEHTDRAQ